MSNLNRNHPAQYEHQLAMLEQPVPNTNLDADFIIYKLLREIHLLSNMKRLKVAL
jgi:hypothetical protein